MHSFKSIACLLALVCSLAALPAARATDMSYPSLVPQTNDSELISLHKSQLSLGKLASGNKAVNILATGTTSFAAGLLERVIVNTAGSANSSIVIQSGTVTKATASTAAQQSLTYNLANLPIESGSTATTGTINVIVTGSSAPNLTFSYR